MLHRGYIYCHAHTYMYTCAISLWSHRDLSDGDGHLFGVGSSIDGHAQLLVDLGDWDGQDLAAEVREPTKRFPHVVLRWWLWLAVGGKVGGGLGYEGIQTYVS